MTFFSKRKENFIHTKSFAGAAYAHRQSEPVPYVEYLTIIFIVFDWTECFLFIFLDKKKPWETFSFFHDPKLSALFFVAHFIFQLK